MLLIVVACSDDCSHCSQQLNDQATQNYKLLCLIQDINNQSVCESGDINDLSNIVKAVYLEPPSTQPYHFTNNPPILNGQIGVPPVVDRILGR